MDYVFQGSTVIRSVSIVVNAPVLKSLLWHKRLGHVNERGLCELEKQGNGEKLGKLPFCENCVFGKAFRLRFKKVVHNTTGVLNYVHSDL